MSEKYRENKKNFRLCVCDSWNYKHVYGGFMWCDRDRVIAAKSLDRY